MGTTWRRAAEEGSHARGVGLLVPHSQAMCSRLVGKETKSGKVGGAGKVLTGSVGSEAADQGYLAEE